MGFTLRFMLGLTLVLATCSVLDCASTGRRIRQAPPVEAAPETATFHDEITSVNASPKEENISRNASERTDTEGPSRPLDDSKQTAEKNEVETENKPKTENSTEKRIRDNKIIVNKTTNSDDKKMDKKSENKSEIGTEKPSVKDLDSVAEGTEENPSTQNFYSIPSQQQKGTTENVPETSKEALASRAENARSLDIDISKYVSPEFHNKNNVYSLSVSPDTEKYTNLHNELPKSTTSRLPTQVTRQTVFGSEFTTPSDDDFAKKFQTIEDGVKQKLEYIDHQFAEADYDFKKSQEGQTVNIDEMIDESRNKDTVVNLNFTKFKNIVDSNNRDKNSIHKEIDVESGQNLDFSSSYNRTQIFDEPPKDYKNKIPTHREDFKTEVLPEHSDVKSVYKPTAKPVDGKYLEPEVGHDKIPEIINFKDSTSLTKPPSLNQTENHKSLLSNKIETEAVDPVESSMKLKWGIAYGSPITTEITTSRTATTSTTIPPVAVTKSGQQEEVVYVPYGKGNLINVNKRGSTKFVDTVKITTTTESSPVNKNLTPTVSVSKNKLLLINKQALANKENKTIEQSVLENQVYPVQIPAPSKEQKNEQTINGTTKKSVTTEDAMLSLKTHDVSHISTSPISTFKPTAFYNETEETTVTESLTTIEPLESTTYTINSFVESVTVISTTPFEETTIEEFTTEPTTIRSELETTTIFENFTLLADVETTISTTTSYPTTMETETFATDSIRKNDEFSTTTFKIDFTTDLSEESSDSSQESTEAEVPSSEDSVSGSSYSTDSEYPDYSESNTTASSYEDSYTSVSPSDYSEYDERSSSGRDLKDNSDEASFSSMDESLNNVDINSPSTTEKNFIQVTTEYQNWLNNKTELENATRTNEPTDATTTDYRENAIIKQSETTSTTKRPDESSQEFGNKNSNLTDSEEDEHDNNETGDEGSLEVDDHSTLKPRNGKPHPDENVSEATPFIIPFNISVLETDSTDSTTIGGNMELGSEDKVDGNGGPIAAIIISCIGAACLVLLAGLLFIMRKRHKRFNYGQRCTPVSLDAYSVDNVSVYNSMRRKGGMRASKRSYGNPAFEDPSSVSHSLNFPALAKFAGNTEGIATEFEEIPQVTAQTNELPEGCETKNRYANVIPLPETRVFLKAIDGYPNSDYINANYVTGPRSVRGYYIACQAPLQNTVDDFWRMVWEQQSKVILMLTHLFENGTEKCSDYLPPSEVLDCHRLFGDFQVTLKKREVKEKYVISSLQLKNMVSNSWREVTHLWYLGWPEKGVPSEANSVIAFLIEARSYYKQSAAENGKPRDTMNDQSVNGTVNPEQSPVIVHCSPGTGRTGTVIACDIAIREFELTRQVDIPKTVYKIRRDRASSVQTKEQYAFIYKVICLYATKLTGGVLDSL